MVRLLKYKIMLQSSNLILLQADKELYLASLRLHLAEERWLVEYLMFGLISGDEWEYMIIPRDELIKDLWIILMREK